MGSSKKHKKHKEKKTHEENGGEQRPLKLVLKVGSSSSSSATAAAASPLKQESTECKQLPAESDGPPKLTLAYGQDPQTGEITVHHSDAPNVAINTSHSSSQPMISSRSPQRTSFTGKSGRKSQFQQFLSHLLKQLQRRDPQEFFAWPVTDLFAPGYSSIISDPMDFSTMKKKIDQNCYKNLSRFKADVKLICDNATTYNRPDTIYNKAARKLWRYAKDKIFSREAIAEFVKLFPGLTYEEIGFTTDEIVPVDTDFAPRNEPDGKYQMMQTEILTAGSPKKDEAFDQKMEDVIDEEDLTAEQILEEAKKAAQAAADKLTLERPKGAHLSFLRQREDGTTTLAILGNQSEERVVNIESLVGKVTDGISSLPTFKEDESNLVKAIQSADTPPFSSYLPSLDSSNATLSQEETSMLLSAYGEDELGVQYAQSLLQFSADSDFALNMVDNLLDVLTHGQHSKVLKTLKEQEEKASEQPELMEVTEESDEIQLNLNEANSIISDLHSVQHRRLASTTQLTKPSKDELKLAHKLSNKLCELIANYSNPADVSDSRALRKAMGVQVKFD
ncbi:bromodomain-containing protein 7-like isoform X3 [Dinothrombium tinctorium]|uniref:Bromodomain-containing protein 7-like isoform X3 n=1 Tax=Dinothrombium tinctorium TaxID=1965070 RepID=A0A3S3RSB3_9ACAR|nr:bromodomain-containing protein 7-like isoform X3 [Dinothrombium tinctorium]